MSQSNTMSKADERAMKIDWVLEQLDALKWGLNEIDQGIDPPYMPSYFDSPPGGASALEAIAQAIFKAEEVWRR